MEFIASRQEVEGAAGELINPQYSNYPEQPGRIVELGNKQLRHSPVSSFPPTNWTYFARSDLRHFSAALPKTNQRSSLVCSEAQHATKAAAKPGPVSIVVESPEILTSALSMDEIRIVKLTLKGDLTVADLLQTLNIQPPSRRESIRELSVLDLRITADKLANLKSLLPNLKSIAISCTVRSPQEVHPTLKTWKDAAIANGCKVMISRMVVNPIPTKEEIAQLTKERGEVWTKLHELDPFGEMTWPLVCERSGSLDDRYQQVDELNQQLEDLNQQLEDLRQRRFELLNYFDSEPASLTCGAFARG